MLVKTDITMSDRLIGLIRQRMLFTAAVLMTKKLGYTGVSSGKSSLPVRSKRFQSQILRPPCFIKLKLNQF